MIVAPTLRQMLFTVGLGKGHNLKVIGKRIRRSSLLFRLTLSTAVLLVIGLCFLSHSRVSRQFESKTILPILFSLREKLGKSPALSPDIKVLAVDDVAAAKVGRSELTLLEWAKILEVIDRSEPRAILIDALFSLADADKSPEGAEALKRLRAVKTPIYSGAFGAKDRIAGREIISLSEPINNRPDGLQTTTQGFGYTYAYGPHKSLSAILSRPGHLYYGEEEGGFYPFIAVGQDKVIPHIAFRAFADFQISEKTIRADGFDFPYANDRPTLINFSSYSTYMKQIFSLDVLLGDVAPNARLGLVKKNDIVVLVPMLYTGNTDFKPSPIGLIPGALAHVAVLNSILTKNSLVESGDGALLCLMFALIVGYFGAHAKPARLVLGVIAASLAWFVLCALAFIFAAVHLPYLIPQIALIVVGLCLLIQRIHFFERSAQIIRSALEGVVRPESLKALERNPEKLSLVSKEREITVVFIDIVSFSLMMETKAPDLAFRGLQDTVEQISAVIHKHGGIVNKTLGDGLLCFFGYAVELDEEIKDHANAALSASLEIQSWSITQILTHFEQKNPLFPLRIGINTSHVFIGNVGSRNRIDLTLIGSGVNHAKRLEAACRTGCVLVGTGTFDLISKGIHGEPHRRFVFIKHHEEQVECWEYDPIMEDQSRVISAMEIAEREAVVYSRVQKWNPKNSVDILVQGPQGEGRLINYWATGLKFQAEFLIPRLSRLDVKLLSSDGKLQNQMRAAGISNLTVEIISVGYMNGKYSHELRYISPEGKRSLIVADLIDRITTS
ncbi:MAG: adenylate/guanylate cyclase domain-containing protein [Proteobacteria bacterium]|nr:MAG: adenylate/guanylate cyclase domain-containing protein [Pseudomonadota bacterium]